MVRLRCGRRDLCCSHPASAVTPSWYGVGLSRISYLTAAVSVLVFTVLSERSTETSQYDVMSGPLLASGWLIQVYTRYLSSSANLNLDIKRQLRKLRKL